MPFLISQILAVSRLPLLQNSLHNLRTNARFYSTNNPPYSSSLATGLQGVAVMRVWRQIALHGACLGYTCFMRSHNRGTTTLRQQQRS